LKNLISHKWCPYHLKNNFLMPHHRLILNVLIVISMFGILSSKSTAQLKGYFPNAGPDDTAQDVSILQLIAQPEKFDGKRVRFIGFLRIEFEGDAIYLHREDFDHGILRNAVWVNIPADMTRQQQNEVNMRYVICVGVFQAARHGHMGMFSGEIVSVRRLEFWSDHPRSTEELPRPPR
jgi:hypothetical protein